MENNKWFAFEIPSLGIQNQKRRWAMVNWWILVLISMCVFFFIVMVVVVVAVVFFYHHFLRHKIIGYSVCDIVSNMLWIQQLRQIKWTMEWMLKCVKMWSVECGWITENRIFSCLFYSHVILGLLSFSFVKWFRFFFSFSLFDSTYYKYFKRQYFHFSIVISISIWICDVFCVEPYRKKK